MKKMMKVFAMVLALLIATACVAVMAEETQTAAPVAATVEAPKAEEKKEEPKAEEKTETTEAPKAEPTVEVTAEASAEVTAEPSAEVTAEASADATAESSAEVTVEPSADVTAEPSADATVEPSADATVEPSAEPTEVPSEEPTEVEEDLGVLISEIIDSEYADRSVRIYVKWAEKECLEAGDELTFIAVLKGYDGLEYELQWQVAGSANGEWKDISNENGTRYTLVLDEENYSCHYRVVVNITGLAA